MNKSYPTPRNHRHQMLWALACLMCLLPAMAQQPEGPQAWREDQVTQTERQSDQDKNNMLIEPVTFYKVYTYGGTDGNLGTSAGIYLTIPNALVYMRFYPQGTVLPANYKGFNSFGLQMYFLSYHDTILDAALGVLREEAPIQFVMNLDTMGAHVETGQEAVGEGE